MIGVIYKETPISLYQPSNEVCDLTKEVKEDYERGDEILGRTWVELNGRSITDDQDRGQQMFNAFVDTSVEDPAEAWKWRGTRSMARNKGIALHANLTANYLLPLFVAQNENDEVDRDFSEVMRDIVEWMAAPTNSNYQSSFLQIVFGMLTNPVTYLGAEYCEVFQKIKEQAADGKRTTKEILDEVLSGFKAPILSANQVLITNPYERNIQKQRCIIKRRYCEKTELEAKYGDHPYWPLVQEGVRAVYDSKRGIFYDVTDVDHPYLVAEEIYLNRREDMEVPFVNGIYMGDMDDVENNPIKHRSPSGAPKYNIVPFGYSRIGEHFYFYKSQMNVLGWDNMLYDAQSEVFMNRALLEAEMPVAISGSDQVDSDIMFPNAVVAFEDKDTKVTPLMPAGNLNGLSAAMAATEKSMNDSSVNETIGGALPDANQKAYHVAQAQAAAKKLIGATAKCLAESIIQYGDLMKDIAINHITLPEVDELTGGAMKLKYRSFFLPKKGSSSISKSLRFDDSLIGISMSEDEKKYRSMKLLEESGYPKTKNSIVLVNPELFGKFKYLTRVDTEEMFAKNQEYWQPVLLNLKSALMKDPYTNQQKLTETLMESYFNSEGREYTQEPPPQPVTDQKTGPNPLGDMVNARTLSTIAGGATG